MLNLFFRQSPVSKKKEVESERDDVGHSIVPPWPMPANAQHQYMTF